jgi:uncharacterized protein (TIGR02246 family)
MDAASRETTIRSIIAARADAVRARDADAIVASLADDVVTFDVVDPLFSKGKAAARGRAIEWLASYDGPITWEDRDVQVTVDGDVAFSHSLSRVTGKLKTGTEIDMWFRTTLGFRRVAGRWLIAHQHGSEPFDPESGKASLGLKP